MVAERYAPPVDPKEKVFTFDGFLGCATTFGGDVRRWHRLPALNVDIDDARNSAAPQGLFGTGNGRHRQRFVGVRRRCLGVGSNA